MSTPDLIVTYRQITFSSCILPAASDSSADDGSDWVMSLGARKIPGGSLGDGGGSRGDEALGVPVDNILDALLEGRLDRVPLDLKRRHICLLRSNRHLGVRGICGDDQISRLQ